MMATAGGRSGEGPGDGRTAGTRGGRPAADPARGRLVGYLCVLAAGTLWGTSGTFAVALFRLGVPPLSVAFYRPVMAVLSLVAVAAVVRRDALRAGPRDLAILALGGGVVVALFQVAFQLSTEAVGVASTVALLYLAPALVVVGARPLLGEPLTLRRAVLAGVVVGGVWLTIAGARDAELVVRETGIVWGFLAGVGYAAYTIFGRWAAPRYGAFTTLLHSMAGGTAMVGLVFGLLGPAIQVPADPRAWGLLVAYGVGTITAAQLLFFYALHWVEAGKAAIAAAVEPVVAALVAWVLVDQALAPVGWLGLALVAGGVAGAYSRREPG